MMPVARYLGLVGAPFAAIVVLGADEHWQLKFIAILSILGLVYSGSRVTDSNGVRALEGDRK